jgi:outer membrane protein, heavy metal efflux system
MCVQWRFRRRHGFGNSGDLGKTMSGSSDLQAIVTRAAFCVAVLVIAGCRTPPGCDWQCVSRSVESRFGQPIGLPPRCEQPFVPEGLAEGRPLAEDEAVFLALYNNAAFHEALVEIDLTRADLIQAGLLPNPEFLYYFQEPQKPFRYLFDFALESLWLRPIRLKSASAENDRACAKLTQTALDLIRDTRQAYADLQLAADNVKVAERAVVLRERILALAEDRAKRGDASELELSTARIDALQARQALTRTAYDVTAAGERLRNFTGLSNCSFPLINDNAVFEPRTDLPVDELVAMAIADRPDAQAATNAARAAEHRLQFAKLGWFRFLGIADATTGTVTDHVFGPGLRVTVPIFNRNQGGIARAEADLDQLTRRRQTVHNQIVLDVRQSYARYQQARAELDFLRKKTRPEVETAINRAEAAYKRGDVTYLIVLEMNRQLIDAYAREALLYADLRRTWAELERSVGRRLR